MVNSLVQVLPSSSDSQRGAVVPQVPEKAVITISFFLFGLTAILTSPSPKMSVFVKLGLVLFTTVSTTKTAKSLGFALPRVFKGSKSFGSTGREYELVSFGALRTLSSAVANVTSPEKKVRAKPLARAVLAALRTVLFRVFISLPPMH